MYYSLKKIKFIIVLIEKVFTKVTSLLLLLFSF